MICRCRICEHQGEMEKWTAREMLYGTHEEFDYFLCPNCNCLQILKIPENLGEYYRADYYSYERRNGKAASVPKVDEARILDVGCGSGDFLCNLAQEGFVNLYGCDPFIEEDIVYENGITIYKRTIHEMEGEYDRIYLNDSFEHMTDPHEVMDSIKRLLSQNGIARIKLPVFPNIAFEMFDVAWYQLDAPRHIFLHSKESLQYLADNHGLRIVEKIWDSSTAQIVRSYLYKQGIPYIKHTEELARQHFTQEDIERIKTIVETVNQNEYGDHAVFFLMKK